MGVCDNEAFEVAMTVIYPYSLIIGAIYQICEVVSAIYFLYVEVGPTYSDNVET